MAVTELTTSWLGYNQTTGRVEFWDGKTYRPLEEAAGYALVDHTHALEDVVGLTTALSAKANLTGADFTGGISIAGTMAAHQATIAGQKLTADPAGLYFNNQPLVTAAQVGAAFDDYLPLHGGTLTGTLALPQLLLHAAQPLTADPDGLYTGGKRILTEANRPIGILRAQQAFIASASWTKPVGVQRVLAWLWGAGGGGGGAEGGAAGGACGGGGGAGGFGWKWIDVSTLASVPVTIGAPGAAGAATGGNGGTGGTTSFGTHLSATGGTGGSGQTTGNWGQIVAGGSGGVASDGDFNVIGSPGSPGIRLDAQNGIAGRGAPAAMIGGGGNGFAGNTAGQAGFARGDGGGGGVVAANATGRAGGAGASGMVWLWMFE